MPFPKDFLWGAATSSYQIEGAVAIDGKGPSVWDAYCRAAGAIEDATTGESACDHYHRLDEDVALMSRLGIDAYRFSVSWPRVLPDGIGAASEKGLAFYDRLVDQLLAAGIRPFVTLFHWDYPLALYQRGGWLNPDSPKWFAEYATLLTERLSDRVSDWMTHNEPQCFVGLGHSVGRHAPGLKLPLQDVLLVSHNSLLAHGHAVRAIRAGAKTTPNIGWATVAHVKYPATDSARDLEAAKAAQFGMNEEDWFWSVSWFGDPMHLGAYPEHALRMFGARMPKIGPHDMETIHAPLDYIGLNIYSGTPFRAGEKGPEPVRHAGGHAHTDMDWFVTPEALRWGPVLTGERYNVPSYITENGMANLDWVMTDGAVHDPQRIDFLHRYLTQLEAAADAGADVRGYFHWSLLDNFEWGHGYKKRFGLIHVDFETRERTPKDSFEWYRNWISAARAGTTRRPSAVSA